MTTRYHAVVAPFYEQMGLDIARSLGKQGIPVIGIKADPRVPAKHSRYCTRLVRARQEIGLEQGYLEALIRVGEALREPAVLYPLSDVLVDLCSRERQTLQRYYRFMMPDHDVLDRLQSKDGLGHVAARHGIPAPMTIRPSTPELFERACGRISYPAIIKPTDSSFWHEGEIARMLRSGLMTGQTKVVLCRDEAELRQMYGKIAPLDSRVIIQEVIPGEDERLVYVAFYADRDSLPLAMFAGRKHRILPMGFGSASFVRSEIVPQAAELVRQLVSGARYQGLGGIEFKQDPRDDRFKLIEFNTRFGLWDGLGTRCGVNLPHIAYRDALGLPVEPQFDYRSGVIWVDWQRDVRAAWVYRKAKQLTLWQWLRSLRGEKMWATYSRDDWRPGIAAAAKAVQSVWRHSMARLERPFHRPATSEA